MKVSFPENFSRCLVVLLLFTIGTTNARIMSDTYEERKDIAFNFSRVDLEKTWNKLVCFRACNADSSCLGVGMQIASGRNAKCFKIKNDTAIGDSLRNSAMADELLYLKVMQEEELEVSCTAPFRKIGNLTGCYYIGTDRSTWDDAQTACQALDLQAHLVSFESRAEKDAVSKQVRSQLWEDYFWTGGKDHNGDNQLTWTGTGESLPSDKDYWHDYAPKHGRGDCISLYRYYYDYYFLSNNGCQDENPYVCEIH